MPLACHSTLPQRRLPEFRGYGDGNTAVGSPSSGWQHAPSTVSRRSCTGCHEAARFWSSLPHTCFGAHHRGHTISKPGSTCDNGCSLTGWFAGPKLVDASAHVSMHQWHPPWSAAGPSSCAAALWEAKWKEVRQLAVSRSLSDRLLRRHRASARPQVCAPLERSLSCLAAAASQPLCCLALSDTPTRSPGGAMAC